jgi:hypothetical protein
MLLPVLGFLKARGAPKSRGVTSEKNRVEEF